MQVTRLKLNPMTSRELIYFLIITELQLDSHRLTPGALDYAKL